MSDQFQHLRPRAAEDVLGRIDGGDYCEDCGGVFHADDMRDGICERCQKLSDGDPAIRPACEGIEMPRRANCAEPESPSNLPSPGRHQDDAPVDEATTCNRPAAHCLSNGDGIHWSRIKNLFNIATSDLQFDRLMRFIRKRKTEP